MALDEIVLDSAPPGGLVLRFYRWPGGSPEPGTRMNPAAVTFGYFQTWREVSADISRSGVIPAFPVVRRPTGGGIVYHDGDITFSLVFPWDRFASTDLVYKDLHRGVHLGLKGLGLGSRLWSPTEPERSRPAPSACFAAPSPMDLVLDDGAKVLGGALRRRRGVGLYQGSFRPEGYGGPRARIERAIREGMSLEWTASFMPEGLCAEWLEQTQRLRADRYMTDEWNLRR